MSVLLPLRPDLANYSFQVELDSVTYGFRFFWNERDPAWVFSITDVNGNELASGIKVAVSWPLAKRFSYNTALPPGLLVALDTSGMHQDPGGPTVTATGDLTSDLGNRVQILYFPVSTFKAA
jgi:hypothetical protein